MENTVKLEVSPVAHPSGLNYQATVWLNDIVVMTGFYRSQTAGLVACGEWIEQYYGREKFFHLLQRISQQDISYACVDVYSDGSGGISLKNWHTDTEIQQIYNFENITIEIDDVIKKLEEVNETIQNIQQTNKSILLIC